MPTHDHSTTAPSHCPGSHESQPTIAQLAGQVYEAAPAAERCRLLEHLMRPLGALSLVAVANGVFAKLWFRSGWHELHIQPDDAQQVRSSDVVMLVDYLQQGSVEVIDELAQLVGTLPMLACTAAAAMLLAALVKRAQIRKTGSGNVGDCPFRGT